MKKFIAKIHLWLSIPFGLVITILCLTGAILIFESEIKEICNPSMYKASMSRETPLAIEELIPIVKQQLPDSIAISSVQIPASLKDNYRMGMTGQGRTSLLVDPYTGEIKGKVTPYEKGNFFSFVRRLHRWFLLQNNREGISWGKLVTGSATLVFVFILITGLIVWIPKTIKGLKRKLSIKTGKGGFRFWYDTHLAGGMYVILFLLVMALTGLTWSFNWYRTGFYKVFGVEVTQNAGHGQPAQQVPQDNQQLAQQKQEIQEQPQNPERGQRGQRPDAEREERQQREGGEGRTRNTENAEREERGQRGERGQRPDSVNSNRQREAEGENPQRQGRGERTAEVDYAIWTKVAHSLANSISSYRSISIQNGTASVSINNTGNTRASDRYTFDPRTGEITNIQYYKDQPKSAKIRGWIYAVHVGSWGGMFTRILYFIACLIGASLPLTGYYIWLKKRWLKKRK